MRNQGFLACVMFICCCLAAVTLPAQVSAQVQVTLFDKIQNAYVTLPLDNSGHMSTYYSRLQSNMALATMGSSLSDSELSVVARLRKFSGTDAQPYRTYYKSDETIYLDALWPYFDSWQSSYVGQTLKITYKLNSGGKNIFSYTTTTTLTQDFGGWCGFGIPVNLSDLASKIVNKTATFVVTFSVNGIVNSTDHTALYITDANFVDLPIQWLYNYTQTNWFWKNDCLGDCVSKNKCIYTMGDSGCATTSKAFIFTYLTAEWYSPQYLNFTLTDQGGYLLYKKICNCACPGNEEDSDGHYLNLIGAPADTLFEGYFSTTVIGIDRIKQKIYDSLDSGFPVLLNTKLYGQHYVVAIGYRPNGQLQIFDPLDGQLHLMETRGLEFSGITGIYLFSQWQS